MTSAAPMGPLDGSLAALTNPHTLDVVMPAEHDLMEALEELDEAMPGYARAHNYYTGAVGEFFASPRMRWAMMRTGIAFRLNFARIPVDAVTERLKITAVSSPDAAVDEQLQGMWKRNKLGLQFRHIIRAAGEFGDSYVIVWPSQGPDDGDGDMDVDIAFNSPHCVRIIYSETNPLVKKYAIKRWTEAGVTRVDLIYPDRIEKWRTLPECSGQDASDWVQHADDPADPWPLENPFGVIPVFHFRNAMPYGSPEHEGFYGPQDMIHKLAVSHMAGVDYQSFPQRYALMEPGADTTEAAQTDEDVFAYADTGTGATRPPTGEARSQLSSDPGSVWFLKGLTGVGQFEVADPLVFTGPMLTYLRMGAEITNTPLHRVDPTGDAPSGESLRAAEAPFIAKVDDRSMFYTDTAEELFRFALVLAGFPDAEINVQWAPAQTISDLEGWQTVIAKMEAGVPFRQAMIEAGYDSDLVDEWDKDRQAAEKAAQVAAQAAIEAQANAQPALPPPAPDVYTGAKGATPAPPQPGTAPATPVPPK